ncbi:MAG: hypothetical protein ACOCTN_08110, partial [Candidatus Natronoplasma sp.]
LGFGDRDEFDTTGHRPDRKRSEREDLRGVRILSFYFSKELHYILGFFRLGDTVGCRDLREMNTFKTKKKSLSNSMYVHITHRWLDA